MFLQTLVYDQCLCHVPKTEELAEFGKNLLPLWLLRKWDNAIVAVFFVNPD